MQTVVITVCHIITGLRRGGAEASLLRLVTRMDRKRFRNVVITLLPPTGYWDDFVEQGVEVHSVHAAGPALPAALPRLWAHLRRVKPDVLQTWLYHADLLGATICRAMTMAPLVWNIRNSDMTPGNRLSQRLMTRALAAISPSVRVAVVNSQAGLDAHRQAAFRPQRWELIPNGYDLAILRPDAADREQRRASLLSSEQDLLVGMVARVDAMKGHSLMLEVFAKFRTRVPTARLALVGTGTGMENTTLSEAVVRLGLEDSVLRLGERRDVPSLLRAFDVVVLPSIFGEGFPNAICEAMASGVPVIATDVGDVARIVRDGGIVVPKSDHHALLQAMLNVSAMNQNEREALGRRGREQIKSHYALEVTVQRYESLYRELVATD